MKVLSYSGYDTMTIEVEETPWWYRIFNKPPKTEKYTGHHAKWRNSYGDLVDRKRSLALEDLWVELRDEIRSKRNKQRGRV